MPAVPVAGRPRSGFRFTWIAVGILLLGAGFAIWRSGDRAVSGAHPLAAAREAAMRRDYPAAIQMALQIPAGDPEYAESRRLAGEMAEHAGRRDEAIRHLALVPLDGSQNGVRAGRLRCHLLVKQGQLWEAACGLRELLAQYPDDAESHGRLALLLHVSGQRWLAREHYLRLIELDSWKLHELAFLADVERPLEQSQLITEARRRQPDDFIVILADAVEAARSGDEARVAHARDLLDTVQDPLATISARSELALHSAEIDTAWMSQLPDAARDNPDYWLMLGLSERRAGRLPPAVRCFSEALRRAPVHRQAIFQLSQALPTLDPELAQRFAEQARQMSSLTRLLDRVLSSEGHDEEAMTQAVDLLIGLGRLLEARAWAITAVDLFPDADWPRDRMQRVASLSTGQPPRLQPVGDLSPSIDLTIYPLPALSSDGPQPLLSTTGGEPSTDQVALQFDDVAIESGIAFIYSNGDEDPEMPGARMFEQTGGGVAVWDYDLDGWPDLYFPQGTPWPLGSDRPSAPGTQTDALYRNSHGRAFRDRFASLGITDAGFGQGAAVGDFNSDGFPDLYVAQVGRNQLLLNNGDGTLTDVTDTAGLSHTDWTTSCLVADLNSDGHPDLFDVNYVTGPQVYELTCGGYGCSPENFAGTPDRLLISAGDGTFTSIAEATPSVDAKGLGVLAFPLQNSSRLSLFIANDQVPNFLLENQPAPEFPQVQFTNIGLTSGLAFNKDGLAMASMGVAASDLDGNGELDFVVSTFRDEPSMVYLQESPGLFVDSSARMGVVSSSLRYVGWGAQCLDADLDGDEDLVVVNGHVDNYAAKGQGYAMPAQLFVNRGGEELREQPAASSGNYFSRDYIGRGLSRLDWNRDGRPEFAVSNIHSTAGLAINRTATDGSSIRLQLVATDSAREALGARMQVQSSRGRTVHYLTGGDGYMASNERCLQVGLPAGVLPQQLTIDWPSGRQQTYALTTASGNWLAIEGTGQLIELPAQP